MPAHSCTVRALGQHGARVRTTRGVYPRARARTHEVLSLTRTHNGHGPLVPVGRWRAWGGNEAHPFQACRLLGLYPHARTYATVGAHRCLWESVGIFMLAYGPLGALRVWSALKSIKDIVACGHGSAGARCRVHASLAHYALMAGRIGALGSMPLVSFNGLWCGMNSA
jgi:hypothetical protein